MRFRFHELCKSAVIHGRARGPGAWRGEEQLANGTAGGNYRFRGLPRGLYSLKAGERESIV